MSEIIVRDLCPHCGKNAIVYMENDDDVYHVIVCQFCKETLEDLPWKKKMWFIVRELIPAGKGRLHAKKTIHVMDKAEGKSRDDTRSEN